MKNKVSLFKGYLLVFLFPALSGCGLLERSHQIKPFPKKSMAKKTQQKEKKTWQQIKNQKNKPFSQRIKDIESFIQTNEDKEIALDAYLLRAKLFLKNRKYKAACLSYHKVVQSSFDYTKRWEAYRASAKCHFRAKKGSLALKTLESLIQNPKADLKDKKASAQLQWDFLKNKKAFIKWKLTSLSHLFFLSSNLKERQEWKNKGEDIIRRLSPGNLILYANQAEKFGAFEGYLLYKAGKYFVGNKELSKAKSYFKKSLSSPLSLNLKKEVKSHLMMIKKIDKVNPYLIGALIPFSGRRKALGEKILRGLYMGLNLEKGSSWQIVVMDSKSHPDVVQTQLDNLFYKHHVIGLIGGLTSETAEVIAERAETFAIPAVLFSQKKGLSLNRDFIFQNAITAEQLLKPLVEQVNKKLKIKKTALLYPDDFYGKEYTDLFSQLFQQAGGEITKHEIYKTGEVDFKKHIINLLNLNVKDREEEFEKLKQKSLKENPSLSGRSRKLTPENLLPPKIDFSALFIPDSLDQVLKIKDHLKYFGIKDIYLLGTDIWRPQKVSYWSEEQPLVFVNLPEKDNSLVQKSLFYKEFLRSYAHPPGLFEQKAYNAAVFLRQALDQGAKTRLSLQKALKKITVFQGAYHKIAVSKDGGFNYPLNIYKTSQDKSRVLDSVPVK